MSRQIRRRSFNPLIQARVEQSGVANRAQRPQPLVKKSSASVIIGILRHPIRPSLFDIKATFRCRVKPTPARPFPPIEAAKRLRALPGNRATGIAALLTAGGVPKDPKRVAQNRAISLVEIDRTGTLP